MIGVITLGEETSSDIFKKKGAKSVLKHGGKKKQNKQNKQHMRNRTADHKHRF